ncbi:hypothetical protein ACF0H5_011203 [Mactra antiquata]
MIFKAHKAHMNNLSNMTKTRICVIGAGPCGMSMLYNYANMDAGSDVEIVCYEKQTTWGGLWNLTWRTGTDEYGEPCHAGMYKHLWSNGPKECLEYPYYTFEDHFGKAVPSFPPRPVLLDYLLGRMKKCKKDPTQYIKFSTAVRFVKYNESEDNFTVTSTNLVDDKTVTEKFTHVVVAVGIFNSPNIPTFPGIESFGGRILHAHNFRDAGEFKDQRLLLIGASYSAEDIALQCCKYGAKNVICTWRTKPMGFKWPEGIEERPLVQRFDSNSAYFKDGTSAEVDAVILCTGYLYTFPFMDENLRLKCTLSVYPEGLYKGSLWLGGGNNKLFYAGIQDQYYTFTMFDVQTLWICNYILGKYEKLEMTEMLKDSNAMVERRKGLKDCHDDIDFQSDFVAELCSLTDYDKRCVDARSLFHKWEHDKDENIKTYRDKCFASIFTSTMSPSHSSDWWNAFDDSIKTFVGK